MTAKQAIKARCKDCAGVHCTFTDCALTGLAKSKGKVKTSAIKAYCRWCLNKHPFSICNSLECAIYQFRNEKTHIKNTLSLPKNRGYIGGFLNPNSINVNLYGKESSAL